MCAARSRSASSVAASHPPLSLPFFPLSLRDRAGVRGPRASITSAATASLLLHGAAVAALLLTFPGRSGMDAPAEQALKVTLVSAQAPGAAPDSLAEVAPLASLPPDLAPNSLLEPIAPPEPMAQPAAIEPADALAPPDSIADLPPPPRRPVAAAAALPRPVAPPRAPAPQRAAPAPRPAPGSAAPDAAAASAAVPPGPPPGPPPVTTEARYRHPPAPPVYPAPAISMGITGSVVLRALVGSDGDTQELRIWRSSGNPLLDNAALAAARRWAFAPARNGAHPIAAWVEVPVHFRLN
jgi:protein TonB